MCAISTKKPICLNLSAEVIEYCVELVTVNGMPLSALECSELKHFISIISQKLGITINRQNIREHIIKKFGNYRKLISNETKNKMLSIFSFDIYFSLEIEIKSFIFLNNLCYLFTIYHNVLTKRYDFDFTLYNVINNVMNLNFFL